ncbi:MAG: SprB repeat-containing protein, partial [Bacteroidetes bacterium]|nr:SprB repeat-containing protein [Bacteroidota bacterium]
MKKLLLIIPLLILLLTGRAALAQTCGIQSISFTDVLCFGDSTGSAVVTMDTTGTPPYSYSWNTTPVQTDSFATGLTAGTYTVTVTDDSGCVDSAAVIITEPPVLAIIIDSTKTVSCFGISDGVIYSSASGGTSPLLFSIDTGATFQASGTFDSLAAGAYSIIVRDSNGCSETTAVTITQPLALTIAITDTTFAVCGDSNGTATGTPSGGTQPFTYLWNDPLAQTDSTADSLAAGTYSVTVTDSNGCIAIDTVYITEPVILTIQISLSCEGFCDGIAIATPVGGKEPYTYLWDDSLATTDSIASNLCAGVYSVIVNDSNACED